MRSDIEIANESKLKPIQEIAENLGLSSSETELYGNKKAKINSCTKTGNGKLILVTAMNPTPAGEGKTTISIGLAQGLQKIGKKAILALREPSLGPVFGVKGGAAGGGYSQVLPMEELNLHFTGDIHAVTTANNLLSAIIDNHLFHGNTLQIDSERILWRRCMDMNDRALRQIDIGLRGEKNGVPRADSFSITAASEIMAILCLSLNLEDLKDRLSRIIVAFNTSGDPVTAGDLKAADSMTVLLKDAIKPNLVQTIEHVPALIHGGPFANISHGCSSIRATELALQLSDFVVTEAGFGADLGAEKFLNIKCRAANIWPDAAVIVATIRSIKYNAGISPENLSVANPDAVRAGFCNLEKHIENMKNFGVPCVVTANRFITDTEEEIETLRNLCVKNGVLFSVAEVFTKGGDGGKDLANQVLSIIEKQEEKPAPTYTYDLEDSIEDKIRKIAGKIYGAKDILIKPEAQAKIDTFTKMGYGKLPVCIAKTQYSLSDKAKVLGRPKDFTLSVRDISLSAGAGYLVILTGTILTMPGLPLHPAAENITIQNNGEISGLF